MRNKLIIGTVSAALISLISLQGYTAESEKNSTAPKQYADVHFHISNYSMQGMSLKSFLDIYMNNQHGNTITRSVVMPIPLQQKWDIFEQYANNKIPPNYYLGPKSELYYYSFVDAMVAKEYEQLSASDKNRLDPMITGFNPMDHYAAQHIKRVLLTFPGVFSGIGEFSVHKEIVSNKIAGNTHKELHKTNIPPDVSEEGKMTLYNPSLIDIFNVAAETGLVATLHNDIYEADVSHDGKILSTSSEPHYLSGMKYLCKASPDAKVIWAHTGLGRFVKPNPDHLHIVSDILDSCPNWYVDISWDLVQLVIINPKPGMPTLKDWAAFITKYQDRVLWGSDTVLYSSNKINGDEIIKGQPISAEKYHEVVDVSDPLLEALDEDVAHKVRMTNYLKLFDTARINVRAWEKLHANDNVWDLPASVLTEHTDLVFAY